MPPVNQNKMYMVVIILCSVSISYLDEFMRDALGREVVNIFNPIYTQCLKIIFLSFLKWYWEISKEVSCLFQIVSDLWTMNCMPDPSEILKCLPVDGEMSASLVEATRTYHVTNGRQMTNVQCASLVISDQTPCRLYLICPGHLHIPGRVI